MKKHTPGPWTIIEKPNGTLGIGAKEPDGTDCRPAQINGTAVEEPWAGVTWANARLIAAAPDLLDACKAFLRAPSIGSSGMGSVTIEVQTFNLEAARAAIAKAEGGAT